jgi:hypothetical protein
MLHVSPRQRRNSSLGGFIVLTDRDVDDIVAYLKLL